MLNIDEYWLYHKYDTWMFCHTWGHKLPGFHRSKWALEKTIAMSNDRRVTMRYVKRYSIDMICTIFYIMSMN
jgi:hypothetical protein